MITNSRKMEKRILGFIVAVVLSAMTVNAEPITREQARKKAEVFMASQKSVQQLSPVVNSRKLSPKRRHAPRGSRSRSTANASRRCSGLSDSRECGGPRSECDDGYMKPIGMRDFEIASANC